MCIHTVQEAARILRVHRITLLRWIKEGRLATVRPPGCRKHLIPSSAIDAFIEAHTTHADPECEHQRLMADFKQRIVSR